MIGEIIAIGDELTSGRILNTTSSFAASQLFAAGHEIFAMHTIGDSPALIGEALKRALSRVDFVIVTGGLGATTDDLTNEAVADALNRPPTLHREILARLRPSSQGNQNDSRLLEKLAWLPEGAEILNMEARMAGYLLVYDGTPIFFLPGIPSQMKELFIDHVLPCLAGWSSDERNYIRQQVYRTFGATENMINRQLAEMEQTPRVKIGYYPVDSEVHVSLTVVGRSQEESDSLFDKLDTDIRVALGTTIYGFNQETLAGVMGNQLMERNWTITTAESCTGGLLASKITETAGCSDWFAGGLVVYSNALKEKFLGVDKRLIAEYGAVSVPVARAMAEGAAAETGAAVAAAITGIAGPSGGTEEKPVGTVFVGLYVDGQVSDHHYLFSGTRKEIQEITAQTVLNLVRHTLLQRKGENNGRCH